MELYLFPIPRFISVSISERAFSERLRLFFYLLQDLPAREIHFIACLLKCSGSILPVTIGEETHELVCFRFRPVTLCFNPKSLQSPSCVEFLNSEERAWELEETFQPQTAGVSALFPVGAPVLRINRGNGERLRNLEVIPIQPAG